MSLPEGPSHDSREAEALQIFGAFFGALSVPVLIGTAWSMDRPHAAVVSVLSGFLLLVVAVIMFIVGTRLKRKASGPRDQ